MRLSSILFTLGLTLPFFFSLNRIVCIYIKVDDGELNIVEMLEKESFITFLSVFLLI